ncbi:hypothetical protein Bhyg_03033 [Pseudolycoriella hygida]|uniref:Uncharacterized protein n=1 Tax=Pseudolycoriella hygida TaxID=35572 RepID=A0A9Q0S8Z8_9DIPT|nr:hypothetical protein Bhyg_03033 [Pseudolycoriella hygida]
MTSPRVQIMFISIFAIFPGIREISGSWRLSTLATLFDERGVRFGLFQKPNPSSGGDKLTRPEPETTTKTENRATRTRAKNSKHKIKCPVDLVIYKLNM